MPLGIAGEEQLATSDDFLDLETLPRRIVLVGGGYIAFEFAYIVRRAGAEVVVLEQGSRFLSPFDQDLVGWLVGNSRKLGIELDAETSVAAIEREGNGLRAPSAGNGNAPGFTVDLVVTSAGSVPATDAEQLTHPG